MSVYGFLPIQAALVGVATGELEAAVRTRVSRRVRKLAEEIGGP